MLTAINNNIKRPDTIEAENGLLGIFENLMIKLLLEIVSSHNLHSTQYLISAAKAPVKKAVKGRQAINVNSNMADGATKGAKANSSKTEAGSKDTNTESSNENATNATNGNAAKGSGEEAKDDAGTSRISGANSINI